MDRAGRRLCPAGFTMMRPTALAIASVTALGCGARTTLDVAGSCLAEGCDPPRVADCERLAPEATPLAVIRGENNVRFTSDDDAVYFRSEGRIHRLPHASGAAVALTPELAAGGGSAVGAFDVGDGVLAWLEGTTLRAMPVGGGDVRTLAELPEGQVRVVVAPGYVVTFGTAGLDEEAPVYRVPLAVGAAESILSANVVGATRDDATGRVVLATREGLLAV